MLNQLTLVKKLIIAFAAVVSVFIIQNFLARMQLDVVEEAAALNLESSDIVLEGDELLRALADMEAGQLGFALTGNEEFLQPYEQGRQTFESHLSRLRSMVSGRPAQLARLNTVEEQYQEFITEGVEPIIRMRRDVDDGFSDLDLLSSLVAEGRGKAFLNDINATMSAFMETEAALMEQRAEAMDSSFATTGLLMVVGPAIAAILAFLVVTLLARDVRGRFRDLLEIARAVGSGDFSKPIRTGGRDEVATVLEEFASMQSALRDTLGTIRQGSERLMGAGQNLNNTVQYLGKSSDEQSEFSSRMAATTEELTVSIAEVTRNAEEAREISATSETISREGSQIILGSVASMSSISERVQKTAMQINELSQQSGQISNIISVIDSVSEQTNLLALNAAIEAARAGEHGRGFAVVADEVRGLAQRAAESTQEISRMINQVQAGIQFAVTEMESTVEQVREGVESANRAGDVIREIEEGSRRVMSVVDHISSALNQQSEASDDVARSVERIASLSNEGAGQVKEVRKVLDEVRRLSDDLEAELDKFVLNA